jgi:hypothetical protein
VARKQVVPVKGERGGSLFVAPTLSPGSRVITEGRAALKDGDHVAAKLETAEADPGRPIRSAVATELRP